MVTINEEFVANEQMNNCVENQISAPQPSMVQDGQSELSESGTSSDEEEIASLKVQPAPNPPPPPLQEAERNPPPTKQKQPERQNQMPPQPNAHHKQKPKKQAAAQPATEQQRPPPKDLPARTPEAAKPMPPAQPQEPQEPPRAVQPPQPAQAPQVPQAPEAASPAPAPSAAPASPPAPTSKSADGSLVGDLGFGAIQPFPHMEAFSRVLALPVVESGVSMVTGVYIKVKNSNSVVQWGLGTAEGRVKSALGTSMSLLEPLSGPLAVVDALLCRGLDMVEYNVPIITLPPELLMSAGRDYMTLKVVAPVLRLTASNARRADTLAARALESADHYVDKFLPGDAATENGDVGPNAGVGKAGAALQRVDRLTRKLQRRITRRTLAEARALRKHSEDTLHTLLYFAETLIKDPRAFVEQCRAVWAHLSENEPENQVPPDTLEERLALLVREVARRVVHLANYTASNANAAAVSGIASNVLKSVSMEGTKVLSYTHSQLERIHMNQVLGDLNAYTHLLLERLAHLLAGLRNSSTSQAQPFVHGGTNNIAIVN